MSLHPLLLVGILLIAAMTRPTPAQPTDNWSYLLPTGPAMWGRLDPAYQLCDTGQLQSPIGLSGAEPANLQDLSPNYRVTPLKIDISAQGMMLHIRPGSRLVLGNWEFELKHASFKMPGEHVIEGARADMEIQLHHQNAAGEIAVIGVPVMRGRHTLALDEIAAHLPRNRAEGRLDKPMILLNARDLLPDEREYYRYMGSLTRPPCTEGVHWYVLKTPLTASGDQLKRFRAVTDGINRPLQQRGNRLLLEATSIR